MAWFEFNLNGIWKIGATCLAGSWLFVSQQATAMDQICGVNHVDGLVSRAPFARAGNVSTSGGQGGVVSPMLGVKRLLLLRVDFPDLPGAPLADLTALNLITNLSAYFDDSSYGRFSIALPTNEAGLGSAITSVLRMPQPAAYYGTNQLFQLLRADARMTAAQAGWLADQFDLDIVCMGRVPGFTWSGLGNIGSPGAWLRNQFSVGIAAHELGHNLGLRHANLWDTAGQSVIGPGVEVEYGDHFDTMGSGGAEWEFNARYKEWLHWIEPDEWTNATTNGIYRVYAHDGNLTSGLTRALVVAAQGGTNYWIEYRQRVTLNPWSPQGVQLRWGFRENQSTLLLDTTPGTTEGRLDAPLLMGRTFSDTALGLHVTVLGPGATESESMDLMVNRGAFVTNLPPRVTVMADTTNLFTGQLFTGTATAFDPNADALAFHWDFGDGAFGGNTIEVQHAWSVPGEYLARCEVSDMKGGRASDTLIVRVGSPITSRISGMILTEDGDPVEGVRVSALHGGSSWTTSMGHYDLVGIPAGNYSLEAVLYGFQMVPENFANPVSVGLGMNQVIANFRAEPNNAQLLGPLVPAGSIWRFCDEGKDLGTAWKEPDFNDQRWGVGPAQLGYGDGDEATLIDYGPFTNNKHITTYFRHEFQIPDPATIARLSLHVLRDDGAVVYLNGRDVFRSNLPEGRIGFDTRALETAGSSAERMFFETDVFPFFLRPGRNVLAVEVHQQDRDSSDLSFDLFLNASTVASLAKGVVMENPREGDSYRNRDSVMLFANAWAGRDEAVNRVDFYADQTKLGQSSERPFIFGWEHPPLGHHDLTARAYGETGTILTSAPISITVADELIGSGSNWRFFDKGMDLGLAWASPDFDDRHWYSGPAELGYGDGDEVTLVSHGPDLNNKPITTYFRRAFRMVDVTGYTNLRFRLLRDDGAVVWLNGVEQWRSNMPLTGTVNFLARAVEGIGDEEEWVYHETDRGTSDLKDGRNVVAVEVHQRSPSSSDISFDLELLAGGPGVEVVPRLSMSWMENRVVVQWPTQDDDWGLVAADDLDGVWEPVLGSLVSGDGITRSAVDVSGAKRFYRLRRGD